MSRRLNLLQAGPLPPPWSGIGVSLQELVASQPLQSQNTLVLDTSVREFPGDPRRAKRPTPRRIVRHALLAVHTARLVRDRGIDVFHLHGSSHDLSLFGNALSILAGRRAGARTVWHLHDDLSAVAFPGRHHLSQAAFSMLMRLPDILVVLSDANRELAREFVDARRLAVLPPTCSPSLAMVPVDRPERIEGLSVLFVGWLTAAKGIFDLLRVAELLRDAQPRVRFDVVGSGMSEQETADVQAAVMRAGLQERVCLRGVLHGNAKQEMFARANIFFLPTHWDAYPVVVLEAMAAGLPIVGTDIGGLPGLVAAGQGGLLTAVGATNDMAVCLLDLVRDRARRLSMGHFNRQRFLDTCHPDVVGRAALDLYRSLVGRGSAVLDRG